MLRKLQIFLNRYRLQFERRGLKSKPNSGKNLLIIKDDAIGDLLMSAGVILTLKQRAEAQGRKVYLLVDIKTAKLAELYFPKDQLLPLKKEEFEVSYSYRKSFLEKLDSLEIGELIASSTRSTYCDHIAGEIQASRKYALKGNTKRKREREHVYTDLFERPLDNDVEDLRFQNNAIWKEHILLEGILGSSQDAGKSNPRIPKESLVSVPLQEDYFVFLPDAGDLKKTYSKEQLLEMCLKTAETRKIKCVVLSAFKSDEKILENPWFLNLTTKTNLVESLSYIQKARFVLSNETGLGHATWMLGAPLVFVLGGGTFRQFSPRSKTTKVVNQVLECYDCNWQCKFEHKTQFPCVGKIPPKKIQDALLEIAP